MRCSRLSFITLAGVLSAGIAVAAHGAPTPTHADTPGVIDLDSICTQQPAEACHAITRREDALARVNEQIRRISGGNLPGQIDVTEEPIEDANKALMDPIQLPAGRQVWYVRTYAPVTLTAETGAYLAPGVNSLYEAHGAAFVIDAQTGSLVGTAAFH